MRFIILAAFFLLLQSAAALPHPVNKNTFIEESTEGRLDPTSHGTHSLALIRRAGDGDKPKFGTVKKFFDKFHKSSKGSVPAAGPQAGPSHRAPSPEHQYSELLPLVDWYPPEKSRKTPPPDSLPPDYWPSPDQSPPSSTETKKWLPPSHISGMPLKSEGFVTKKGLSNRIRTDMFVPGALVHAPLSSFSTELLKYFRETTEDLKAKSGGTPGSQSLLVILLEIYPEFNVAFVFLCFEKNNPRHKKPDVGVFEHAGVEPDCDVEVEKFYAISINSIAIDEHKRVVLRERLIHFYKKYLTLKKANEESFRGSVL